MKTKRYRWLFAVAIILTTVILCVAVIGSINKLPPSAIPWLFFCGLCILPATVGVGAFTLLMNFAKRAPRLDVHKSDDDMGRRHTVLELSAVTPEERRALDKQDIEE